LFFSQLILVPVLVVFSWIYLRMWPGVRTRVVAMFDIAVIGVALLCCVAGLVWIATVDPGDASPIWIPILSAITTFHIFPVVLFIGWLIRNRYFA